MNKKVVAAGHICLDITPVIPEQGARGLQDILIPGSLLEVETADIHTGGSVANTGLAMKFLGADVMLVGKIGDDAFGKMVTSITDRYDASDGLIISKNDSTSYSMILAVPGFDRIFLHNRGANDTFCAEDIPVSVVREAALFHFGYPTQMKLLYKNDGEELVHIMRMVKNEGCATSLDLAMVDPNSTSGRADWRKILSNVLPFVDIFVPSIEELSWMLKGEKYEIQNLDVEHDVPPIGQLCLDLGAKIVLIKCGALGMYYCTKDEESLKMTGARLSLDPGEWADRKGFEQAFKPERVLSGTGAGDTSIAAFLVSMLNGHKLNDCVQYAAATGACCVAAYDALSGLKSFDEIDAMIAAGWEKNESR